MFKIYLPWTHVVKGIGKRVASRLQIESIRALSTILYHKKSQILGLLNDVVSSVYASEQVGNDHLSEWTV